MKKVLSLILALSMILAFAACKKDDGANSTPDTTVTDKDLNNPEALAEKYVAAVIAGDGEAIYKLTMDQYELKSKIESGFFDDEAECIADCTEDAAEKVAEYEADFGTNLRFSDFEIAEQHIYSEEDLSLLIKYLEEGGTYPEGAVTDIQTLKVGFNLKGDNRDATLYYEQSVAKIDGRWYWGVTNVSATYEGNLNYIEELKSKAEQPLTPEKVLENYFVALAALDCDAIFDLCIDPASVEKAIEDGKYKDEAQLRASLAKDVTGTYETTMAKLGDNRKVTKFEISETREVSDDGTFADMDYVLNELDDVFDASPVQKAMAMTVSVTITGDKSEISDTVSLPVVQIDGKWYVGDYLMSAKSAF